MTIIVYNKCHIHLIKLFVYLHFAIHLYFTQFKLNKQTFYKQLLCVSNKITIDTLNLILVSIYLCQIAYTYYH